MDILNSLIIRALRVLMAADLPSLDPQRLERFISGVIDEALAAGEIPDGEDPGLLKDKLRKALTAPEGESMYEIVPGACDCRESADERKCISGCPVDAIVMGADGKARILMGKCINCGLCSELCGSEAIIPKTAVAEYVALLKGAGTRKVYAIVAPSFAGQFGKATPKEIRVALRRIGFADSFEVALAADILTIRESEEYADRMKGRNKFMITSCCCPAFVKLVDKYRPKISHLISESVSPMVACARLVKEREPDSLVVFISPCLAKRAEARDPEFNREVDLVLTYREIANIFKVAGVDPDIDFGLDPRDYMDASHDGRIYAFTGGVSYAIQRAVGELDPTLPFTSIKGNGIRECQEILKCIEEGSCTATFMEGMGCVGGCVGGPATNRDKDEARIIAEEYAQTAKAATARDNRAAEEWFHGSQGLDLTRRKDPVPV